MSIIGHGVAQGGTYTNNKAGVAAAMLRCAFCSSNLLSKLSRNVGSA
jgi:hypothetical protein